MKDYTQRFPEGDRYDFEEKIETGYEPTYEELMEEEEIKLQLVEQKEPNIETTIYSPEEYIMKDFNTLTFKQLEEELIKKELVFEADDLDQYEQHQWLESVYSWGFILGYSCNVLPISYKLYDDKYQLICSLDSDDDNWRINNGYLKCERSLFRNSHKFYYNLNQGAPIHVCDIRDILISYNTEGFLDTDTIIVLKNKKAYRQKDCYPLQMIDDVSEFYLDSNYKLLDKDCYQAHVDTLNNAIVTK